MGIKKVQRWNKDSRTHLSLERAGMGVRTSTWQARKWKEISMHDKDTWKEVSCHLEEPSSARVP